MIILGISAFYHDSAAAIIRNGEVIAAAQEERFTRIKHDSSFPKNAIKYCLRELDISLADVDAISFYDKPFLKFERLLETYYNYSPNGVKSFITSIPVWVKEKLFLKSKILNELKAISDLPSNTKLLFPEHHLSHAASAYFPSPFNEAAILTVDGVGEWATATIMHGRDNKIRKIKELRFPHSLGLLYSSFTYYLGFKVNSGEYKMMGLAPYGNKESELYKKYLSVIKNELVDIKEDGSIWLNQKYFNYATGLRMVHDKKWHNLLGLKKRLSKESIEQEHMDLALAIQHITEEVVLKMAKHTKELTRSENLCLAGGVALNCVANGKLVDSGIFENIWIQPAAGDAGGALGCALSTHHIYYNQPLSNKESQDQMKGSYLGPEYPDCEVETMANRSKARFQKFTTDDSLLQKVSDLLHAGNVIGWFQGRMEFGPRALGHRSIIASAKDEEMQLKLNLKIKYRESFRPFAPSVLVHDASQYFKIDSASPYMLIVKEINESKRFELPENYADLGLMEKLRINRSDIPSITHVDFSARIQTVDGIHNPKYYALIQEYKKKSNDGVIINTSFNVRGEPIVCSPEDAYRCFMRTEMDFLVIGNYLFKKEEQPQWDKEDKWTETFALD